MKNKSQFYDIMISIIILLILGAIISLYFILSNVFFPSEKYDLSEKIYTNYTQEETVENHTIKYYNVSIKFTLAPIEEYSLYSIANNYPIEEDNCDIYSTMFQNPFNIIEDDELKRQLGCYVDGTTQSLINYSLVNNSNVRQVGDTVKNLEVSRQNITIILTIRNDTLYHTKINVTKINESEKLIFTNLSKKEVNKLIGIELKNASCISYECPKGYTLSTSAECFKLYNIGYKQKPAICNSWKYKDYIIRLKR